MLRIVQTDTPIYMTIFLVIVAISY